MTIYSPKLAELTTAYAAHLEKQMADTVNPKASAVGSLLRTAFRTQATGVRLITKIYDEAGWDSHDNQVQRLSELAALATKSGDPAGAQLQKSLDVFDRIEKAIPTDGSLLGTMKQIKKLNLSI